MTVHVIGPYGGCPDGTVPSDWTANNSGGSTTIVGGRLRVNSGTAAFNWSTAFYRRSFPITSRGLEFSGRFYRSRTDEANLRQYVHIGCGSDRALVGGAAPPARGQGFAFVSADTAGAYWSANYKNASQTIGTVASAMRFRLVRQSAKHARYKVWDEVSSAESAVAWTLIDTAVTADNSLMVPTDYYVCVSTACFDATLGHVEYEDLKVNDFIDND